jgi:alcohol dehydrogenase
VAACTGIDAIAHAVESLVTTRRNPISHTFARQAFRLCAENLPKVFVNPADLEARGHLQVAAAFSGVAIENSMLGAAHAMANPLTAQFGVVHGTAVGLMLPHVVRFNTAIPEVTELYAGLVRANGSDPGESLARKLEELLTVTGMPSSLVDCGVEQSAIPKLAKEAADQWTARFNPRPVAIEDFEQLYAAAFEPRGTG